ncbi:type II secretion system protein [Idiomarina seosinensis]|uniref:Type II secretory pathway, pseudopilin n=1 Tax=Idiomarina seosinensis TaxID=281739 RepID=A0A432ZDI5_9GAMM|nr:type II secretion system protein [Idiomarina seosinensis]RUO75940.1 Type II secretory pathway, pseudopilin [Idiomarina seosinensis]
MRNQKGFTLIELIIVIVVLGILAVTAAPQFINFSSDARVSTVEGAKGSVKGAMDSVYARSLVDGSSGTASGSTVETNGGSVSIVYGYPEAAAGGIDIAAGLDASDWTLVAGSGTSAAAGNPAEGSVGFYPSSLESSDVDFSITAEDGDSCHLLYTEAEDESNKATVTTVTGGC